MNVCYIRFLVLRSFCLIMTSVSTSQTIIKVFIIIIIIIIISVIFIIIIIIIIIKY